MRLLQQRRCADEGNDSGLTGSRNVHRSDGAALGTGEHVMKLDYSNSPKTYTRIPIKADKVAAESKRAQALMDIAIGLWGFAFLVFLLAWLG